MTGHFFQQVAGSVRVDQGLATRIRVTLKVVAVDRRSVAAFEITLRVTRVGLHVSGPMPLARERGRGNDSDERCGKGNLCLAKHDMSPLTRRRSTMLRADAQQIEPTTASDNLLFMKWTVACGWEIKCDSREREKIPRRFFALYDCDVVNCFRL
jgi:hypothetical protein